MRKALALLVLVGAPILAAAQNDSENSELGFPRGPGAAPLLREAWDFAADNIYPAALAERFDAATLMGLESRLRSDNDLALADVLNPFLDSLGVSHTRFYDRRHQTYYMLRSLFSTRDLDTPRLYTIGVQLDEHDPGVIQAVMEGSPAAEAGIRRADKVVAVDGRPFQSLLQWQRPGPATLTVQGASGIRDVTLRPILQGFQRALVNATTASRKLVDCGGRRIGYLHLWAGTNDAFLSILKDFVADARESDLGALVLDLRDGYGGAWWPYLDPFFADRDGYFASTTVNRQGTAAPAQVDSKRNPDAWMGPLAVIINAGTRSGKESLAFQFKKSHRAVLFGTTTAGAFSGGRGVFADRSADYIFYLSVQETLLDGKRIEGVGVRPDVVVADTSDGDAPLSAAIDRFACKSAETPPPQRG